MNLFRIASAWILLLCLAARAHDSVVPHVPTVDEIASQIADGETIIYTNGGLSAVSGGLTNVTGEDVVDGTLQGVDLTNRLTMASSVTSTPAVFITNSAFSSGIGGYTEDSYFDYNLVWATNLQALLIDNITNDFFETGHAGIRYNLTNGYIINTSPVVLSFRYKFTNTNDRSIFANVWNNDQSLTPVGPMLSLSNRGDGAWYSTGATYDVVATNPSIVGFCPSNLWLRITTTYFTNINYSVFLDDIVITTPQTTTTTNDSYFYATTVEAVVVTVGTVFARSGIIYLGSNTTAPSIQNQNGTNILFTIGTNSVNFDFTP